MGNTLKMALVSVLHSDGVTNAGEHLGIVFVFDQMCIGDYARIAASLHLYSPGNE
jgi:hypothetical protein